MRFARQQLWVIGLCACDTLGPLATGPEPEPLPPDLVAACPASARFERSGSGECTDIGCVNGLRLSVSPQSGWTAGAYRFELDVDSQPVACQGSFPLQSCEERSFSCDAGSVRLGVSGCALPSDQQGIADMAFEGYPLHVSVRVLRDGKELVSTALEPAYTAGQPNGPGCEPVCCGASAQLVVPVQ
jgi:hypothetical protein